MPNLNDLDFDDVREHDGFNGRRARLGLQTGLQRVGASLWELFPGQAAYPYHFHLTEDELLILLEGTLSLRTPDGWRELEQGEVVGFPVGESGAHQVVNRTESTVRFLAISNSGLPEAVVQVDEQKIGIFERGPNNSGIREWYRRDDAVPYFEGVAPPES
ncbi:MAG: cupin domain-containing protein [Actinomycetota bacterium]|nr:cupin domain-containing protein [Actinomycetota bacterium]